MCEIGIGGYYLYDMVPDLGRKGTLDGYCSEHRCLWTIHGHTVPDLCPIAERDEAKVLKAEIVQLADERDALAAWKKSAISVTPPLQEIAKALGVPLGESIHDKILPGILALKGERDAARALLREALRIGHHEPWCRIGLCDECNCGWSYVEKAAHMILGEETNR